jgi:hypothetical protein
MAIFVVQCDTCGCEEEFMAKIDDRDRMNGESCPYCDHGRMYRIITPVAFGCPVRMGLSGKCGGMKEVLQKIHANTPGSQIDKQSTINKI